MTKLHSILLIFLFVSVLTAQYDSIYVDGNWRSFLTHLPPDYPVAQETTYALVLALHGGLGSAENLQEQSQLSQKVDTSAHPFIVVYPEGLPGPSGFRTWNAGSCCGYAQENDINDVGFISALIDSLLLRYMIDSNRVYVCGMSNGGMMTYRLAVELSDRIAAIAPVASTNMLTGPWQLVHPIPVIHFHSYQDESIPFEGGYGNGFTSDIYKPKVDSVLNVWSALNGCFAIDTLYHEENEYLHKMWNNCSDSTAIELYVTYDGGHSWPGGVKGSIIADPPSEQINATNLLWTFFQKYSLGQPSIIRQKKYLPVYFSLEQNYPNPFNNKTVIRYLVNKPAQVKLTLYNVRGQYIKALVNKKHSPGNYSLIVDAGSLSSGIYFYAMEAESFKRSYKFLLIK